MQFTVIVISVVALAASAFAGPVPAGGDNLYCGPQQYDPSQYTCYPDPSPPLLCPITNGVVYKRCGSACYNEADYKCTGTQLCPSSDPEVCGTACYNTAKYYCENNTLHPK